ncbi:jg23462 [Pararge aegeria aegeria]|uniref:Jg23462 protein n=1 Tax=Pararge aegeria aegeria TaxID=348720 RepID=A0A8S4S4C8_9NEOP|nr:jg23462 [Pararge aegeria aegeria]
MFWTESIVEEIKFLREWSEDLEIIAQRWADQCSNNISVVTEWCHDLESTSVGHNIGAIYGDAPGLTAPTLVDLWYMELLNMNASYLSRYKPSSMSSVQHYDYFTQLIWAESSQVGCGGVKYKELNMESYEHRNMTIYKLICNFAPSGNIIGQAVYTEGIPCSRCPHSGHCDSEYKYLCTSLSQKAETELNDEFHSTEEYIINDIANTTEVQKTIVNEHTKLNDKNIVTQAVINDEDTSFDFLSHLFDITSTHPSNLNQTTLSCKNIMAVDEFIELLKNKLNNDQSLKDILLSSTKALTPDPSLTDRTVAAIVNQLYSKKETTTVSKSTYEENINSTLLAELVEAVIFRHSDTFSSTEDISLQSQTSPNVNPIKIQAELGEIQANTDFTGHYFFPEEDEKIEPETTVIYDDLESLRISEVSLEIDDLKKNRETKDFLEEILESDFMTESVMGDQLVLNNRNGKLMV